MEYFSAVTMSDVLPRAPWMKLDAILIGRISQPENDKHCMLSFLCGTQKTELVTITKMEQGHRYRDKLVLIHGVGVMEEGQQQKGIQREKYYVQNKL